MLNNVNTMSLVVLYLCLLSACAALTMKNKAGTHQEMAMQMDLRSNVLTPQVSDIIRRTLTKATIRITDLENARCPNHRSATMMDDACDMQQVPEQDHDKLMLIIGRHGMEWAFEPEVFCSNSAELTHGSRQRYRAVKHACSEFSTDINANRHCEYVSGTKGVVQIYDRQHEEYVDLIKLQDRRTPMIFMTEDALMRANSHVFDEYAGSAGVPAILPIRMFRRTM